jgi:hypothetical protein
MALALMRLSTEKFFVLLSLYVAFLLFRVPPRAAAALVALNARASSAAARLILYSFPAVCWVYGAGFTFSTFVSGEGGSKALGAKGRGHAPQAYNRPNALNKFMVIISFLMHMAILPAPCSSEPGTWCWSCRRSRTECACR